MSNLDIFKFHKDVMGDYKSYVSSFINIQDSKIKNVVMKEFDSGKFWPEPLIQFNPSYESGETIEYLVKNEVLHKDISNIFTGYRLYKHQVEAIKLGVSQKSFIVTSGTGSGKSLTFLATIFNDILKNKENKENKGVKAVLVYPMNALINSQYEEIDKYKKNYEDIVGEGSFPITFGKYTGQDDEDAREAIKNELPDIILTNYVMLDLIMTRRDEYILRSSIKDNIKFLVFDELHTYSGRQGSDVGMLIRKIKSQAFNDIITIGTSATMVSGASDSKLIIAKFGKKIFGNVFTKEQIIEEYLARFFDNEVFTSLDLKNCLEDIEKLDKNSIKKFPLSIWLENEIALEVIDNKVKRRMPLTLSDIIEKLYNYLEKEKLSIDKTDLTNYLKNYLMKLSDINLEFGTKYLPYKIHQFISQTGSVKISLDKEIITLKSDIAHSEVNVFNALFGKTSGGLFLSVYKDIEKNKIIPRDLDELDKDNLVSGFLILDNDLTLWPNEEIKESLPATWFTKSGNPTSKFKDRFPEEISFDSYGSFSKRGYEFNGYFMKADLLFDIYDGVNLNRGTYKSKLLKLGSEARSTSTTVLSFSILKRMLENRVKEEERKLLSFTDNRQDAALQTGHFNHFISVTRLRSVIYHTLKREKVIKFSEIGNKIFETLKLPQLEYVDSTVEITGYNARKYDESLKDFLIYKVIEDLKYGWRLVFPNLEQTGLMDIGFENLEENLDDNVLKDVPYLNKLSKDKKYNIIYNLLNFIREEYSIDNEEYLSRSNISSKTKEINANLKDPWRFETNSNKTSSPVKESTSIRYETLFSKNNGRYNKSETSSVGSGSFVSKYLSKELGVQMNKEEYLEFIKIFLDALESLGYLKSSSGKNKNQNETKLYKIRLNSIVWKLGDGNSYKNPIRNKSLNRDVKVNEFFQELYKTDFKNKFFKSTEHTGQVSKDDRQEREKDFREGKYNVLFCSPTMELGIDISELDIVHMRNVPPSPANYVQRSGRAGRNGKAALIFTNASAYSPHDKHYFENSIDMVAGVVTEPRIDLKNEEMLLAHLHSLYLSRCNIDELKRSFIDMIDIEDNDLPIKEEVRKKFDLGDDIKKDIYNIFKKMLLEIDDLSNLSWYDDNWIEKAINNTFKTFNKSLDRWRVLFTNATIQIKEAQVVTNNHNLKEKDIQKKEARRKEYSATGQMISLKNESTTSFSSFYPYRYLASEGFLPGYNFIRLPLRVFVTDNRKDGEYILRGRKVALREYGPLNSIYYSGRKYMVKSILSNDIESKLKRVYIASKSGYFLGEEDVDNDPFTNRALDTSDEKNIIVNLLEMPDSLATPKNRITSNEEERLSRGYDIKTYFSFTEREKLQTVNINDNEDKVISLTYMPSATLYYINTKWSNKRENGFTINPESGFWKTEKDKKTTEDNNFKNIALYVTNTADVIYLEPLEALGFDNNFEYESRVTLIYALKRAIEEFFSVKSNEIGIELVGDKELPNILIYEETEGSLGILRQLISTDSFKDIIKKAYSICHFDNNDYNNEIKASYSDLLSYYNQRFHRSIDRHLIKDVLEKLQNCTFEIETSKVETYEERYQRLLLQKDPNSKTETDFLNYLYENGLRLPDSAQKSIDTLYLRPDFYYKDDDIYIFCDGSVHDTKENQEKDKKNRNLLDGKGIAYLVYYYKETLDSFVSKYTGLFKKMR